MLHYKVAESEKRGLELSWECPMIPSSHEAIISWNSLRPSRGYYEIFLQLLSNEKWTEEIPYAFWGSNSQHMYKSASPFYTLDQDVITAPSFNSVRVKVYGREGAHLRDFYSLHLFHRSFNQSDINNEQPKGNISLPLSHLSQIDLESSNSHRICSPTSTTSVIHYFTQSTQLCPLHFSKKVYDANFSIYGNWVLNVAQASAELGPNYRSYVTRLTGFSALGSFLEKGIPVITSIRGPITGGALPYDEGHLVVVTGYDVRKNEVLCMDPAFPQRAANPARYQFHDFCLAWGRRNQLAYILEPIQ